MIEQQRVLPKEAVVMFNANTIFTLLTFSVLPGLACQGCGNWSSGAVAESQRRGNEIIAAIEDFQRDIGEYPEDLQQLVPKYLQSMKPPTAGSRAWGYGVYKNGGEFNLWFDGPSTYDPICVYSSSSRDWFYDTK